MLGILGAAGIIGGKHMKKGDIVYMESDGWVADSNELVYTTNEELAKKHNIYDEKQKYGPRPVIIGSGRLIKGLEEALLEAEVGKEYEVIVPPEKAYGLRKAEDVIIQSIDKIRRLPQFREGKATPEVGMEVFYRGRVGRIVSMTAGRVRLDFNHPLAGKPLKYKYKIIKKVEDTKEKIKAIIELDFGGSEDFKITLKKSGTEVDITLPEVCKYSADWSLAKLKIVSDLRQYLDLKVIRFIEVYIKKEKTENKESKE